MALNGSSTTQLVYVPDWAERAEARLLVPWRKPKIRALIRALGTGAQTHEDQCMDLIASTGLEEATGHALEQWGDLVGEQKLGLSDTEYRQFIRARMLVNRCSGTVDELLEILALAAGPDASAYHTSVPPATYVLTVVRKSFMSAQARRRVARMMKQAAPAGRRMVVIEALDGGFGWSGSPDIPTTGYDRGGLSRLIVGDA